MTRGLAVAAALAAVLAVAACHSEAPASPGAPQPSAQRSQPPIDVGGDDSSSLTSGSGLQVRGDEGEPGLPEASGVSMDDVLRVGAVATWVDEPHVLAVALAVAEECWPAAGAPVVASSTRLAIEFAPAECGSAHAVRTYTVEVPEGIDPGPDFEVAVEGLPHELTLPLPAD